MYHLAFQKSNISFLFYCARQRRVFCVDAELIRKENIDFGQNKDSYFPF